MTVAKPNPSSNPGAAAAGVLPARIATAAAHQPSTEFLPSGRAFELDHSLRHCGIGSSHIFPVTFRRSSFCKG